MDVISMFKRLNIYYKEMFPLIPRIMLGVIIFGEIYFIILLNYGITDFNLGIQEIVGAYTVFSFYMYLRIADDFKDYETDLVLFSSRPLPSGRVHKKDLFIACAFFQIIAIVLNLIFMNNTIFFLILYGYGFLMSQWFFQKHKIQPNLMLAVVTHNPVQMIINLYIASFTCIKYNLYPFSYVTFFILWTLYFPSLIWEVSRKIRAPKDENDYVTYSKLFGYKKATKFVMILTLVDIITNVILVWQLNKLTVLAFAVIVAWMTYKFVSFIKDPTQYKIVSKVEQYTYVQESLMLLTVAIYLIGGKI
ncbi:4-hydroxybenzoate polyprenyltransferase [[Eubacterium] yurii]|jgi:dimethylallyltranstransferase|nr:4-hydroxybenzoate polyprenyltransferase [[Eubacterium] yurii]